MNAWRGHDCLVSPDDRKDETLRELTDNSLSFSKAELMVSLPCDRVVTRLSRLCYKWGLKPFLPLSFYFPGIFQG